MVYLYLAISIAAEVAGTVSLKLSRNFSRVLPSIAVVVSYVLAYLSFARLLADGFPVGVAYAIWAGAGVAAVAAIGVVFLGEPLSLTTVAGLMLVIGGVLVLELGRSS